MTEEKRKKRKLVPGTKRERGREWERVGGGERERELKKASVC